MMRCLPRSYPMAPGRLAHKPDLGRPVTHRLSASRLPGEPGRLELIRARRSLALPRPMTRMAHPHPHLLIEQPVRTIHASFPSHSEFRSRIQIQHGQVRQPASPLKKTPTALGAIGVARLRREILRFQHVLRSSGRSCRTRRSSRCATRGCCRPNPCCT